VLLGGFDPDDCGIALPEADDEQVSATLRTSVTFRVD
jgi:hypothetical protein